MISQNSIQHLNQNTIYYKIKACVTRFSRCVPLTLTVEEKLLVGWYSDSDNVQFKGLFTYLVISTFISSTNIFVTVSLLLNTFTVLLLSIYGADIKGLRVQFLNF